MKTSHGQPDGKGTLTHDPSTTGVIFVSTVVGASREQVTNRPAIAGIRTWVASVQGACSTPELLPALGILFVELQTVDLAVTGCHW